MNASPTFAPPTNAVPVRASDAEREQTVGILREHWVAGRLTLSELEERSQEAWAAPYVPDLWRAVRELPVARALAVVDRGRPAEATGSLVLSVIGLSVFLLSFSLLSFVTVPISVAGFVLGRRVRRNPAIENGRAMSLAGEILGATGTGFGCLVLVGWVVLIAIGG